MTHTRKMDEDEGTFRRPEEQLYKCRSCGEVAARCRVWDSSCGGYVDNKYTCQECGHSWWIDGPDS